MKRILCLSLLVAGWTLFPSYSRADEATDREAINRLIAGLSSFPQRAAFFTADADGVDLLRAAPLPSVTISHEPWGEARINFPSSPINTRFSVSAAIRFITPDVALADGVRTYNDDSGAAQTTPLLFVMKREGDQWKIASVRITTPIPAQR